MAAARSPFRDEHMEPRLVPEEIRPRGIPQCALMPQVGGRIVYPGFLLFPKINHPMQVTRVLIAVAHRIAHGEPGGVPGPLLRMGGDALRLQSVGLIGPGLPVLPPAQPAEGGAY